MESITPQDIRVRRRGSQDNHRNALQRRALLDFLQNLPAVFLGQVQIKQDQIRARRLAVLTLTIQKVHCFCPVRRHVQVDIHLGVFKRFPREPDIAGAVLNQKNLNRFRIRSNRFHRFSFLSGRAKWKVEPFPGCDSTQILPPSRSTIFLQMANPIPVPSNSLRPCSRWKRTKILSKYWGSIPRPLSRTEKIHSGPPFFEAEMCTWGLSALRYLIAFPTRF